MIVLDKKSIKIDLNTYGGITLYFDCGIIWNTIGGDYMRGNNWGTGYANVKSSPIKYFKTVIEAYKYLVERNHGTSQKKQG